MKTPVVVVLLAIFSAPLKVGALDPSQRVLDCFEQKVKTSQCEAILCEWNNAAANWPKDTGYYRECPMAVNETNKMRVTYAGLVGIFGFAVFVKFRKKRTARRSDKTKK